MEILFNLNQDAGHKTLSTKNFEFILSKKGNIIIFDLSFILLLVEIHFIAKKQSYQENVFRAYGIGHVKIIFTLLIEVVRLYI